MLLSEADIEGFNIDTFLVQCVPCDCMEIVVRCMNFGSLVQLTDSGNPSHNTDEVMNFTRFIKHLLVIITKNEQAVKPMGMSDYNFLKVKPLIDKLVAGGYLKKNWLSTYACLRTGRI